MRTLFLDCSMGAAGDMLTGALLELLPEPEAFAREFNSLGIPGVTMELEKTAKCGILGTHVSIKVDGMEEDEQMHDHPHHHHTGMAQVRQILRSLPLPEAVRRDAEDVYLEIAEAESHAHGMPVEQIHFHEVGTMDAIADVTAVCMLIDRLAPEQIIATAVHVGSGTVRCAHGILPVPAPATAYLLREIPIYGGSIRGELCTPTGAALLRHFVTRFGDMPRMRVSGLGYGMGQKDFPQANCVRAMLGSTEDCRDQVSELSCNVDDMTGEQIGFATERLLEEGALDVYTVPIGMKKSRPGILIRLLCREQETEKMARLLFRYTSTIGIRRQSCSRYVLDRQCRQVKTPLGVIRRKDSTGYGVTREKYEYEDLAEIARREDLSISQVLEQIP